MMNSEIPPLPSAAPKRGHRALVWGIWALAVGLLANAGVSFLRRGPTIPDFLASRAFAQTGGGENRMLGAAGLFMAPAQLGPNVYGMYLLDLDSQTVCVYRVDSDDNRFRLISARKIRYDRELSDFNNHQPTPSDVQRLVDQQRQREQNEGAPRQP